MESLIVPIILLGIILVFGAVFLIVNKKQSQKGSIEKVSNKSSSKSTSSKKETGKAEEEVPKVDVFKFMEFDKILNNMIVQNKGTKFTMAIKCKGINYDLMSDVEQIAVEEGFITFLNTLRYPIQLYVQVQNIDLKGAISTYKKNASGIKEEFDEANKEYTTLLEQFDANKEDLDRAEEKRARVLNVYEYASDIINYVERLSLNKNLLERNFYVLVSYHTSEVTSADSFSKEELINICYNELLTRAQGIIGGLAACSVTGQVLTSNEIADLLYTAYNRDDKGLLNVKEAIDSGFYRLYSTSQDVFMKKQEKLQEKIMEEAEYKAIEAIQKAIKDGTYVPPQIQELNILENVSKTAAEFVKLEDIPQDIKDTAKQILVEDYKESKKKILDSMSGKTNSEEAENKSEQNQNNETKTNIDLEENKKEEKVKIENESLLDDRMGFESPNSVEVKNTDENKSDTTSSTEDDLII